MAVANVKLPKIPHSGLHRQTDINNLQLTGNALIGGKPCAPTSGIKVSNKQVTGRPSTVPTNTPQTQKYQRPKTTQLSTNQLFEAIADKLRGNGFFIMKNTFNSFDPEHKGTVSREALYRILCNTLGGIAHSQFRQILDKIGLSDSKKVSFHEFYVKFRITPSRDNTTHWLDKIHGSPHPSIKAEHVHSMLAARASQCVHNLRDFIPQWKGLEGQIDRVEFRNILNTLSFSLTDEQYHKLWNRYDPSGIGFITGFQLLDKLGVKSLNDSHSLQSHLISETSNNDKSTNKITALETTIGKKTSQLLDEFIKQDINNSGKINSDQVYTSLHNLGILMTKEQCNHIINRLGFQSDRSIVYQSLINALSTHSTGGLTHAVLTDASQKFRLNLSRQACVSTPDAEATLVCSLHKDFLQLMSQFKLHDPEKTGLISRDDFINVVKSYLPTGGCTNSLETLADKLLADDKDTSRIMYSKFLSMFDETPQPIVENKLQEVNKSKEIIHNIKEVREKLIELCTTYPGSVLQAYETLDPKNTSRITQQLLQQILFRLGLNVKNEVVLSLWSEVLKNKDGSIHPHELVRHFTKRHQKHPKDHPTNNWQRSDDKLHMRSKFLHRDIDIVLKNLHTMLSLYHKPIYTYLRYNDPSSTGLVSSEVFQQLLLTLCPQLSCEELVYVTKQFEESANMINYTALMKGLSPIQPVYKTGNDLGTLLSHCPAPTVSLPVLSFPVSSPPQHGLPGVKVKLQRKLMEKWSELKRNLVKLDPFGTGTISVKSFRQILTDFGVSLSREDMYYILQELDPLLTGKVNYAMFLQLLMGRQ